MKSRNLKMFLGAKHFRVFIQTKKKLVGLMLFICKMGHYLSVGEPRQNFFRFTNSTDFFTANM